MIPKKIIILAAMESEIAPIRKKMLIEKEEHQKKCSFYWGEYVNHQIILIKSGVGRKNTLRVLRNLLLNKVYYIINIGLAGAIVPYLKIGDIIVPRILKNMNFNDKYFQTDPDLIQKIDQSTMYTNYQVELVTSNITCSRKEKEKLRKQYPLAGAVDMEAFYIGQYCAENKMPFLIVRAISDAFDFTFPGYYLTKEKFTLADYPKILRTIISNPHEIIAAVKLRYNCRTAIKNNCEFLERYLRVLIN